MKRTMIFLLGSLVLAAFVGHVEAKPFTLASLPLPLESRALAGHPNPALNGPGNLTFDPNTGLEWLDWTLSAGRSYDDVSSQLGSSGDFAGFRYATLDETRTLFDNGGAITTNWPANTTALDAGTSARPIVTFLGDTDPSAEFAASGTTADEPINFHLVASIIATALNSQAFGDVLFADGAIPTAGGHALVRIPQLTPEPGSLILWMLIAAGAAAWGWRRRRLAGG